MARADTQAYEIDELRVASSPERTIWNSSLRLQLELLTPDSTLQTTGEKKKKKWGKEKRPRGKKKKQKTQTYSAPVKKKKYPHTILKSSHLRRFFPRISFNL